MIAKKKAVKKPIKKAVKRTSTKQRTKNVQNTDNKLQVAKSDVIKRHRSSTLILQNKMIQAMEKNLGVVTTACTEIGIHRSMHYHWMQNDEKYYNAIKEIENVAIDFVESKLHACIKDMDTTAIIFFLKTKGKERGYSEKHILDVTNTVRPDLSHLSVDELQKLISETE